MISGTMTEDSDQDLNSKSIQEAQKFLDTHISMVMVVSLRLWSNLTRILNKVCFESRPAGFRDKEKFIAIVGDGSRIKSALPGIYAMKYAVIELQKERAVLDSPELLKGLDRNVLVMLGELFSATDQLHGFFDSPLHEQGFEWLNNGEAHMNQFFWRHHFIEAFIGDYASLFKTLRSAYNVK